MNVSVKGGKLIIEMPINDPLEPSSTGKTLIVASSRGNRETAVEVQGKKLIIGLNAYIKLEGKTKKS